MNSFFVQKVREKIQQNYLFFIFVCCLKDLAVARKIALPDSGLQLPTQQPWLVLLWLCYHMNKVLLSLAVDIFSWSGVSSSITVWWSFFTV